MHFVIGQSNCMVKINVEIAYVSESGQQYLKSFWVKPQTTVSMLIESSGILGQFSELSLETISVGIFSKKAVLTHKLTMGDRVEIYRPLTIDPMQKRRNRAAKKS
jgi:uncharacterized protein